MTAYSAIANIKTLDRRDALVLADAILGDTIATLRRERISSRSLTELELALADLRMRVAERLTDEIAGLVDHTTVLNELEFAGVGPDDDEI
jgi:hypothetical protein